MNNKSSTDVERRKTKRFFNRVSLIYPFIERHLNPSYRNVLQRLDLNSELSVLDLATGTGALAGAFCSRGHQVQGLDFADNLLRRGRRKFPEVSFRQLDLIDLAEIPDNSHGIVCMGYLLHGLDADFRGHILKHAARIAADQVLVLDYGRPGNLFVRFIEWIEGPHYPAYLAASREDEFREAGLEIQTDFAFSDYGQVWLCGHLPGSTPNQ